MAFVSNQPDLEEKQDPNLAPQGAVSPIGANGSVHLSPSGGVASVGGGGPSGGTSGTPTGNATPAPGGQFASLNQYLSANQGQAAPLAGKITTGINNQYNNLNNQDTSTLAGINSQINANAAPSQDQTNATIAQEAANPISFASNPGNVASFQNLLNASYAGPASAEGTTDFTNQQNAVNSAISAGQNAVGTEAGREGLLTQNEATPTTGVTALNSSILSQDPTALGSIENAYQPFYGLLTNLQTGANTADQQIAQNQSNATNANQESNAAINNQINALNTGVTGALSTAQQNATNQAATLNADLTSGNLSAADLSTLGMTSAQWNALSATDKAAATSQVVNSANGQFGANTGTTNIPLSQFLTSQDPNVAYTTANVATPQDYQEAQAFQTLLNGLNTGAPVSIINSTTANQAGTAPTNLNTYNYNGALTDTQTAQTQELASAQAYVAALEGGADEAHAQAAAANAQKNYNIAGVIPAFGGTILGAAQGIGNAITNPSLKTAGEIPGDIISGTVKGAQGFVNDIKNIFCFHEHTPITMKHQSKKLIKDIQLGDETLGGMVLAIKVAYASDMYSYNGIFVTGKHAVNNNGKWMRVEDANDAIRIPGLFKVYNLVTTDHRIWADGIMFADEYETDRYETLDMDESLAELNCELIR